METAELPAEAATAEGDGAPVEGAEATRETRHLFQWSMFVHAGAGAEECAERETGNCKDPEHFHAWICLPNSIQHRDILDKARAAKARRKRALRDSGSPAGPPKADGSRDPAMPPSDAYVMLESELDDLMEGDIETVLGEVADRNARKDLVRIVEEVRGLERFEEYVHDAEEWRRLKAMDEADRPTEEFQLLDDAMTDFGREVEDRVRAAKELEMSSMRGMPPEQIRGIVRDARIEGEATDAHLNAYYTWLAFICTRICGKGVRSSRRYFASLEDLRSASPEAVSVIDSAIKDLEGRMVRGEAAGN